MRDRLLARLAEMGDGVDYQRLAADVLGIRNASSELARRLVTQALVIEDRQDAWRLAGERIAAGAPARPGVYVLRDAGGATLYVGKAVNLRRRLRAHFAPRRWKTLKAGMSRAADADWQEVGSELEALLREAEWIAQLRPTMNVQIGAPDLSTRELPSSLVRDVIVVLPSIEFDSAELVAARTDGAWMMQRTRRSGADLAVHTLRLTRFFHSWLRDVRAGRVARDAAPLAPLVFSWLGGRGAGASRIDPHDVTSPRDLRRRLTTLLADDELFRQRIVVIDSKFRPTSKRP